MKTKRGRYGAENSAGRNGKGKVKHKQEMNAARQCKRNRKMKRKRRERTGREANAQWQCMNEIHSTGNKQAMKRRGMGNEPARPEGIYIECKNGSAKKKYKKQQKPVGRHIQAGSERARKRFTKLIPDANTIIKVNLSRGPSYLLGVRHSTYLDTVSWR